MCHALIPVHSSSTGLSQSSSHRCHKCFSSTRPRVLPGDGVRLFARRAYQLSVVWKAIVGLGLLAEFVAQECF